MYIMINNMVYTGRPQADWKWGVWGGVAPPTKGEYGQGWITWIAARSHVIATRLDIMWFRRRRWHVIRTFGGACDSRFGAGKIKCSLLSLVWIMGFAFIFSLANFVVSQPVQVRPAASHPDGIKSCDSDSGVDVWFKPLAHHMIQAPAQGDLENR